MAREDYFAAEEPFVQASPAQMKMPADYGKVLDGLKAKERDLERGLLAHLKDFYLSLVDDKLRHPADQPSIGLILCKERNKLIVEYAFRDIRKPMGIVAYELFEQLPEQLQNALPSVEDLERGIGEDRGEIVE
ncbi:MAG TPA: PDDEXK nuclease domain-containing protein [Pantanalinema sp.]